MKRITLLTNPDVCNLKCPLCFLQQGGRSFGMGEMPLEVAKRAIEVHGSGLREVIPSTMGEPLLYSDFPGLLDFCISRGLLLNLTTNGTFPGQWGSYHGMELLLKSCKDIKISTLASENFPFEQWKENVLRLLECRRKLKERVREASENISTVSLQVTLHRKNWENAIPLMRWAESVGIQRIKWNPVVFLSGAPEELVQKFQMTKSQLLSLREKLVSKKIKCEGSLFFDGLPSKNCIFENEIWILPDGTEDSCPNPERRFGNPQSVLAQCESCIMFNSVRESPSILNLYSKPENLSP